jgi:phasin family protein
MFDFDPAKVFAQVPQVDLKTLFATQQKNFDAFVKAGTLISEGTQSMFKRQAELAQESLSASLAAAKEPFGGKDIDLKKSMALVQTAAEKAASDTRELVELMTATQTKAFEVLRARGDEAVAEFKGLVKAA